MFCFDAAKLIKNIDIANTLARIICCGGLFSCISRLARRQTEHHNEVIEFVLMLILKTIIVFGKYLPLCADAPIAISIESTNTKY
jgi:hypothetical protein